MHGNSTNTETSPGCEGICEAPRSHREAARFLLPPLGIFVLANIIFSLTSFDIAELVREVRPFVRGHSGGAPSFPEARARVLWSASVVLFFSTFIGEALYCIGVVRSCVRGRSRYRIAAGGAVVAVLMLAYLFVSSHFRTPFSYLFYFTFDLLETSGHYTAGELTVVRTVLVCINILAALIPTLALVTGCCIMCGQSSTSETQLETLKERMRRLKVFIATGAVLLATGILHMVAWLSWPLALVEGSELVRRMSGFSGALSVFWGMTFSLTLAAFYIPAAWSVHRQAVSLFRQDSGVERGEERDAWLEKHGLSLAPLKQLPQVAVILAPLLAGPLGTVVETVAGSLTGG